jgi:hypothetical protein
MEDVYKLNEKLVDWTCHIVLLGYWNNEDLDELGM